MWLNESTFYQIYPLGFCNIPCKSKENPILHVKDWIAHLNNLGVDCVLFNPLFESDSHGYDTKDFKLVDQRLGSNEDFQDVCTALKKADIRVVLDGVFNHVGRGFWAFQDVIQHREQSPYTQWFHINFDGNSDYDDGFWYEGWEGHFELVKLNLHNPEVVDHLLDAVTFWINYFDIDGLRLDVAYSLDFEFMKRLRMHCTSLKPDFALIGEVLHGDYNRIVNDEMLQSCTNYECYKGLYSSMNDKNLFEISHSLNRQFGKEDWCIYRGKQLMCFVDNHDVSRIYSILTDKNTLPLVYTILFTMPGIPCIYYGSEWGVPGEKRPQDDWNLRPYFEHPVTNELTTHITSLIHARKSCTPLNYGDYQNICVMNQQLLFKRSTQGVDAFIAINISNSEYTFHHSDLNQKFTDLLSQKVLTLNGTLTLSPYSSLILATKKENA